MRSPLRPIDANANRAREAARVAEDAARFLLDDAPLAEALKTLRHDLAGALGAIPGGHAALAASRDTPGDVGTDLSTEAERTRATTADVALAGAKRLTEALRAIEEFAKAVPGAGPTAGAVERLRYRAYDLERRLVLALGAGRRPAWRLCVLITEPLCARPWLEVARLAIDGGADCLQLREKGLPDRETLARARALVDLARPRGVAVVVNDRVDLALASGADGAHLGQDDLAIGDARALAGDRLLLGVSCTAIDQARAARRAGADVCGVGPMFPTATKANPGGRRDGSLAGPALLRDHLASDPPLPHPLAIGGITPETARALADVDGAFGVAACAAVVASPDPARACADLLDALARPAEAGARPA